jgi:Flp pilus assembly protein TadG
MGGQNERIRRRHYRRRLRRDSRGVVAVFGTSLAPLVLSESRIVRVLEVG